MALNQPQTGVPRFVLLSSLLIGLFGSAAIMSRVTEPSAPQGHHALDSLSQPYSLQHRSGPSVLSKELQRSMGLPEWLGLAGLAVLLMGTVAVHVLGAGRRCADRHSESGPRTSPAKKLLAGAAVLVAVLVPAGMVYFPGGRDGVDEASFFAVSATDEVIARRSELAMAQLEKVREILSRTQMGVRLRGGDPALEQALEEWDRRVAEAQEQLRAGDLAAVRRRLLGGDIYVAQRRADCLARGLPVPVFAEDGP